MDVVSRRRIPAIAMTASALSILIAGPILHIAARYVAISVLAALLGKFYAWKRSQSTPPPEKGFWITLRVGSIFADGEPYGVVPSLQEGWQWIDLRYLTFPAE